MQISLNLVGAVGRNGVNVVLVVERVEQDSETEFVKYRTTNVDIWTARFLLEIYLKSFHFNSKRIIKIYQDKKFIGIQFLGSADSV